MNQTIPSHVAIIMDGNGRWAERQGRARTIGHICGARVAKRIITAAVENNIKNLTLFAFSTENWFRPEQEVRFLMRLLRRQMIHEIDLLIENNVRFRIIGDRSRLPNYVQEAIDGAVERTAQNTGMNLVFALSYGGRQEIVEAAKLLAQKVHVGEISPESINESLFSASLESHFLPDPDLIIRTSGESRISNFFLWQSAYSEIYIHNKLWPDFSTEDFEAALMNYSQRDRRLGRVRPKPFIQQFQA